MAKYDENLRENPFYSYVKENHCNILQRAAEENWLLCVPRKATILDTTFCQLDVLKHTLVPDERDDTVFTTLTDQRVSLLKDSVITDQTVHNKSPDKKSVVILFSEVLYEDFGKYRLVCLECPLFSENLDETLPSVLSIHDAINFLCQGLQNFAIMNKLDSLAQELTLKYKKMCELEALVEATCNAYKLGYSLVMNQASFKVKVSADPYKKKLIELSVITYLQHKIFPPLLTELKVLASEKDALLNTQVNNAAGIVCDDLSISCDAVTLSNSLKELKAFFKLHTFIDKVGCIKKSLTISCSEYSCMTSDEILPFLSYAIVEACMPNWFAHVLFLKHFQPEDILVSSESHFHVATLEAALEFISSGGIFLKNVNILEDTKEDSGHFLLKSEAEMLLAGCDNDNALVQYFRYIQHSNCVEILNIFDKNPCKLSPCESEKQLCHPLCICSKCSSSRDPPKNQCISPMTRDSEGRTGLHIACFFGCPKVIKLLLSKEADVNAKDNEGNTALHLAAMKGHKNCVLLLLHSGAELDHANSSGDTPLHLATRNGHSGCVKGLLFYSELHGSINCMPTNKHGDTPLHLACKWGFRESVITLLDQMKEGSYNIMLKNNTGLTPSDMCANQELHKLVIESHKQYSCSSSSSPRFEGCTKRPSLDSGCVSQSSPAATASAALAITPNSTVSPCSDQRLKITPDVASVSHSPMKEISQYELQKLENCIEAIRAGESEKGLRLLGIPASISSTDSEVSLCHPLCQCSKCSKTVLQDDPVQPHCSLMNALGSDGLGLLHVASMQGPPELVKHLLSCKCNPNLLSGIRSGCTTALHLASEAGNYDIAQLLVCHGADIDAIDINGNTALHLTAASGHGRLLDLLLKNGANVSLVNYEGQMPEDIAREFGYLAAVEMLLQPQNDAE